ncbi:fibronectin type III domain-containing protein [Tenacibaculum discolor]|uniref:fibronectin type III domain-containing protein n=1 Tax=Tenacibaculum discolor TaxID=361581 RepID=UPI000F59EDDC|nr:fibronectin type III domain-containing protein [Tenacibaculum discolor]
MKNIYLILILAVLCSCSNNDDNESSLIAPIATEATLIMDTSFFANWNLVNDATEYQLQVATDNSFANIQSTTGNLSGPSNVSNLSSNTQYYYRVQASDLNNNFSSYSNIISVQTLPSAPVAEAASSVKTTSFVANWQPVNGITTYVLYVSKSSPFSEGSVLPSFNGIEVTGTSFEVTGLEFNTTYSYVIKAKSGKRESKLSNSISILTL